MYFLAKEEEAWEEPAGGRQRQGASNRHFRRRSESQGRRVHEESRRLMSLYSKF